MKQEPQHSDPITDQACAWIARLESGDMSPDDRATLRDWMQADARHVDEITLLAGLSTDMEGLADQPLPGSALEVDEAPVALTDARFLRSSPWMRLGGIAAALLLAVSLVFLQLPDNDTNGPLVTAVGGYLEQTLGDGTVVQLNTDTSVTVAFDRRVRLLYLHRGELYLQVAHEEDRPLVVRAGDREVRAVGTAFVVRQSGEHIQVMVTEGKVALTQPATAVPQAGEPEVQAPLPTVAQSPAPARTAPILLEAGEVYEDLDRGEPPVSRLDEAEMNRRLAWSRGLVEFTDAPLADIIEEISRYTELVISIESEELHDLRFGGIFPTGEPRRLLAVLENRYGIVVTYVDASTVRLTME